MKRYKNIIFSHKEPDSNVLWLKPDKKIHLFNNGEWQPLSAEVNVGGDIQDAINTWEKETLPRRLPRQCIYMLSYNPLTYAFSGHKDILQSNGRYSSRYFEVSHRLPFAGDTAPGSGTRVAGLMSVADKDKLDSIDLSGYVQKEEGKGLSTNDFTDAYETRVSTLPEFVSTGPIDIQPATGGITLSVTEIYIDNPREAPTKQSSLLWLASPQQHGLLSSTDKAKLNNIDNQFLYGIDFDQPSAGAYVIKPLYKDLTTGNDVEVPNIRIPLATNIISGLMTPTDKAKLDSIEEGSNNYVLPLATPIERGGMKLQPEQTEAGIVNIDDDHIPLRTSVTLGTDENLVVNSTIRLSTAPTIDSKSLVTSGLLYNGLTTTKSDSIKESILCMLRGAMKPAYDDTIRIDESTGKIYVYDDIQTTLNNIAVDLRYQYPGNLPADCTKLYAGIQNGLALPPLKVYDPINMNGMFGSSSFEAIAFYTNESGGSIKVTNIINAFSECPRLKKVLGILDVSDINENNVLITNKAPMLDTIYIKGFKNTWVLIYAPNISIESIEYMIDNSNTDASTSGKLILHTTTKAKLTDEIKAKAGMRNITIV